jgi:SAM-dependent methyltransferase
MPSEWYESFFTVLALDFWRAAVPPSSTEEEVRFLVKELAVLPPARLLDLPSGLGRHSLALARRGYRVTGVDISSHATTVARNEAKASGLDATFTLGDMRRPPPDGPYDAAFCFGNSFGYLSRTDMKRFVRNMFDAVCPGARWAIETGALAESLLPDLAAKRTLEAGGVTFTVINRYDAAERRLLQEYSLVCGREEQTGQISYTLYTVPELHQLLEQAGWTVLRTCGALDGRLFESGDRRLILVAQRPSVQSDAPA